MSDLERSKSLALADLQSGTQKEQFEMSLITKWLDHLQANRVSELRDPIINQKRLVELLKKARQTQLPLAIVAIGCQDWIKPDGMDPNKDRYMGRISPEDKRAGRFVKEMAGFSQALDSFSIPHRIHFSLSDIEALIHMELGNMGLVIHNPDHELLFRNVVELAKAIRDKGGHIEPFIHSQVLHQLLQFPDLQTYQTSLTGQRNPSYREFLDSEYQVDLRLVAQSFVGPAELGPVWLDIQSFNFEDDVLSFAQAAHDINPTMPILSIMPNAGNWHGRAKPQGIFPRRSEVLASTVELNQMPQDEEDWIRKLRKAKNEPLERLMSEISSEIFKITSAEEKTLAVRMICLLAFGFDPNAAESEVYE